MFYHTTSLQLSSFIQSRALEHFNLASSDKILKRNSTTAQRIAALLAAHRQRWGTERMHPSVVHCVAVGCFALLEELEPPKNNRIFVSLCNVARDSSRHFALARGILQVVQVIAQQKKVTLPQETHSLFQALGTANGAGKNPIQFSSLYLNSMNEFFAKGLSADGR